MYNVVVQLLLHVDTYSHFSAYFLSHPILYTPPSLYQHYTYIYIYLCIPSTLYAPYQRSPCTILPSPFILCTTSLHHRQADTSNPRYSKQFTSSTSITIPQGPHNLTLTNIPFNFLISHTLLNSHTSLHNHSSELATRSVSF